MQSGGKEDNGEDNRKSPDPLTSNAYNVWPSSPPALFLSMYMCVLCPSVPMSCVLVLKFEVIAFISL